MKDQQVDVTNVMAAEHELMTALREWRDAGAPVVEVVDRIGRLIDAKLAYERSLALRRANGAGESAEAAATLLHMANTLRLMGSYPAADSAAGQALRIYEKVNGPADPLAADAWQMLSMLAGILCTGMFLLGCNQQTVTEKKALSIDDLRSRERSDNAEIEEKIDALLGKMSVEEKIGQMKQINNSAIVTNANWGAGSDLSIEIKIDTGKLGNILRKYHVGSFLNGVAVPAETWYQFYKDLQEYNMKNSRLKIPIIYGVDHMHGPNYLEGGTIFPHALNTAATYNNQFPADMAYVTAIENSRPWSSMVVRSCSGHRTNTALGPVL